MERTGREPLEFEGDLIVSASTGTIELGDNANATYKLSVFRHTQHGFVASIQYCRSGEHERSVTLSEVLETDNDVENFFFVFEPEEHCTQQELMDDRGLDRDGLLRKLYGNYNEQVQQVVAELRAIERAHHSKCAKKPIEMQQSDSSHA